MNYQISYQVTVFGIGQEQVTTDARNSEEVARRVDDALHAGLHVLITQQSQPVDDEVEQRLRSDEEDEALDRCTCPMSLRERGEHSMGCPAYRADRVPVSRRERVER